MIYTPLIQMGNPRATAHKFQDPRNREPSLHSFWIFLWVAARALGLGPHTHNLFWIFFCIAVFINLNLNSISTNLYVHFKCEMTKLKYRINYIFLLKILFIYGIRIKIEIYNIIIYVTSFYMIFNLQYNLIYQLILFLNLLNLKNLKIIF